LEIGCGHGVGVDAGDQKEVVEVFGSGYSSPQNHHGDNNQQ